MFPFSKPQGKAVAQAKAQEAGPFARAPRLRAGGEAAVATIVKGLQTMAGPTTVIEGMLAGFVLGTPRDILAAHRPETVLGSVVVKDLSCMMLISLDATLVHAIVELLCGGNGAEAQSTEPRAITPIDQQFAQIVFTLAASTMQTDWKEFGFTSARPAKIEGMLTADIFGTRVAEVGLLDITIGIFGLHGTLRLIMPPAVLDRFGGGSLLDTMGAASDDPSWAHDVQREVGRASIALSAYLDAKAIPLSTLAKLEVGQILHLPENARSQASLVAGGSVLYRGEVGRGDTQFSVRIDELVSEAAPIARLASRRSSYIDAPKA